MKLNHRILIIASLVLFAHFGDPFSRNKREKPEVNFYGILFYPDSQAVEVENIMIGRMIRDIVVFQKPAQFPPPAPLPNQPAPANLIEIEANRTKLSLDKICQINTINPLIIYNNRNYVEIEVISNDPTHVHNIFLIEQRKELSCNLRKSGFDKEVSFSALKSVAIQGKKSQLDEQDTGHTFKNCEITQPCAPVQPEEQLQPQVLIQPEQQVQQQQIPADVDMLITKTQLLISELQSKSDELPQSSLRDTIKSLVSELKKAFMYLFS